MLQPKTKQQLAQDAHNLARGNELVHYHGVTYIPADYETGETSTIPSPDRTIWLPLNRTRIRRLAAQDYGTVFASDSELSSFSFMVAQNSIEIDDTVTELLVRTPDGLRRLRDDGCLDEPTGEFRPNTLMPMLNEDKKTKATVYKVISEWLDSSDEASSLLSHLATSMSPGYSAVKYVLLLGAGRNGKSLLMKMLKNLFGNDNVSNVTRQQIAEQSPVVCELNGKLLNLVFDGQAEYLKDSGAEKTLIAGEPFPIRRLYESAPTTVQTNALFVEGLQTEPKSKDKSTALQKRLVRFQFPNVYALDHKFERTMLSEPMLGAFLSLLIDWYVKEDEVAEALAPTQKAIELQLEHMYVNSLGLQFLKHLEETDPMGSSVLLGMPMSELAAKFKRWRIQEDDIGTWAEPDVLAQFGPLLNTERKSERIDGKPRKVRLVTSFSDEATAYIKTLEGDTDGADAAILEAVVDD